MKKYVMLISFTVAVVSWLCVTPKLSMLSISKVDVTTANYSSYQSTVECTGSVIAQIQDAVCYGYSVKPSKVYVKVGETVTSGQKMMDIDKKQTEQVFNSLSGVQNSSAASADTNADNSDSNSLISQYYTSASDSASADESSQINESSLTNDADIPDSIYSALNGVVTQIVDADGDFVSPQSTLAVVTDLSSLKIKAQVDESLISQVKVGQSVQISGTALTKQYTGTVEQIYPTARVILTTTGTKTVVNILINIENTDSSLKPGYSTDVTIATSQKKDAVYIPYEAISQDDKNQEYVYVVKDGRVTRRNITTADEFKDYVEISSGIEKNETIVINSPDTLKSGQRVRINHTSGGNND